MGKLVALILMIWGMTIGDSIAQRPWGAKRDIDFCYRGSYTGIDTIINTDGYYYLRQDDSSRFDGYSFIFFKDGFFAYSPFSDPNITVKNNGEIMKIDKAINGYFVGTYKIDNDTIKAQFSNPPNAMSWTMTELWFEIVNNNTIRAINIPDNIIKKREQIRNTATYHREEKQDIVFIPLAKLPNPDDSWIKKRKWFWCEDALYNDWMNKNK